MLINLYMPVVARQTYDLLYQLYKRGSILHPVNFTKFTLLSQNFCTKFFSRVVCITYIKCPTQRVGDIFFVIIYNI